ncbi:MAG TPA: glutamine--fructose-6-phosphate transaminase (isomerizing) [Candidatus Syntrophosphaera thermopropionivorans]|jgi:glucosamine--fructose-6-phosphate aminotransferase (isomerizing)|uniref:Glutamine--fructose-6-phosphate transaminase (Isomerizing) n=1 Tax=Candidatus Syntrophosphaera thermopropionivorans TaxID=2593015 RepID=A0AC61QKB9_9BACT|nr:glutamine--fructose-6-phosphate transaminase (isomerizing) [Candidatus Syntrophosphaera thermopropionivorans]MBP9006588.1 glutamine--fructose-6-phosphate transaminase (isomerizing) [Candidatus Syntrophosphaera sp.]TDF73873.1 glutamine--fructose-6-phosphate transaminase (isomerizing) [Candidatus Syntrophosphaera thermopropionivorans]HNZ44703.1 glutamine--fructose-6-phosphate transaminase (isomerizing) [Candidatus Syntrophosphaera thermopropionivorans]HOH82490.1 glutamine--fructose-6-phosphate
MSNIVGYIGQRNALPIVIEALKRLEYLGCDSAGCAIIHNNKLQIYKKQGKIVDLERSLPEPNQCSGNVAIAHTRWATHGEPSEVNAHPQIDCHGKIAIVHNGIIENYNPLKKQLIELGHTFRSETDTEVIAHLIEQYRKSEPTLEDAIRAALSKVEGTYGLVILCEDEPDKILAIRKGSPLIVGIGENEHFISSDVSAIVIHTKRVFYLQDDELCILQKDHFDITNGLREKIEPEVSTVDWDISAIDKGPYKHFMLKEIFEQPTTVENAFRGRIDETSGNARLGGLKLTPKDISKIEQIHLVGCGTSYHAALIGKYMIEDLARIPVQVEYASEYRYRNPIIQEHTLIFVISQSGETADTLAALREAQSKGAKVFGITNVVGSSVARESNGGSYIHAGSEIGVASTKAFTSQVTILFLLAILLGRQRNLSSLQGMEYIRELQTIPSKIDSILKQSEYIRQIAETIKDARNAMYLGRGINYPVALEGALKLKEISYIHAEGYAAAEMKHGPIALVDEEMPVVAIATNDPLYDKIHNNLEEVHSRKARLITITNEGNKDLEKISESVIYLPSTLQDLQPLLTVIPLQLLAYYVADLKGVDVDQPRNLAKSVTVE